MTRKYFLLVSFLIIAFIIYSFSGKQTGKVYPIKAGDTTVSYLALYGEYIFKREKCGNCHSLSQTGSGDTVSLDGLQGKFSNPWHCLHLQDPPSIVAGSKMPSFDHLTRKFMNEDTLRLVKSALNDRSWQSLQQQADSILFELKNFGIIMSRKSEILALIAYLQTIPESEELKIKNAEEASRLAIQNQKWDSMMKDANNIIYKTANKKGSIEPGKAIFQHTCFPCHGQEGGGGVGPNLTDSYWLHGGDVKSLVNTIVCGVADKGMPAWRFQFAPVDVGNLVAYIKSINGTHPKNAKIEQGKKE